ncbi:sigma-54-dependent Fis family transcriptional regulator [Zoogloea sp.]|uniref:sigma-54-dependent Fis family transcriptional regulator n=1 Tax=Zoogloea sp. TaxID=49181 RepID=UPI0014166575|nr:MAG: sigma-54-dependent Fis family transcriptional regulator [Zoogloea sp.]
MRDRRGDVLAGGAVPGGALSLLSCEERLRESWRRSEETYRIDPSTRAGARVLTASEFRELRDRLSSFLRIAQLGVSRLHEQVRESGYCVLLTNGHGATIDFRGSPSLDEDFRRRGFLVGACWSEVEEGTCGVGTAIVDRAPILVHRAEHFRSHNSGITCSAAPVFGPADELVGVLNASAFAAPENRNSQAVVYRLVQQNALAIENALFVEGYKSAWTLSISAPGDSWSLGEVHYLAFDDGGRIVAASRRLRAGLFAGASLPSRRLEDLFDLSASELVRRAHERPGAPIPLRCLANGLLFEAQLRAPVREAAPGAALSVKRGFEALAARDPRVLESIERVKRVVDRKLTILLLGETGSGKEAFAKAIHGHSQRRDKPFVALNCAAIPETLIESELFGYKEGAFTGAKARGAKGKVQQSNGGTLFLDEIGDMPLALQTRLLRVLAEGEVVALGASEPEKVDLNVICATHRDLASMVRSGLFREDLFYRLNAAVFRLPPLRERSDRCEVIRQVLEEEMATAGRRLVLPEAVLERLSGYPWPGNIRELRNALRFAVAVCDDEALALEHFPESVTDPLVMPAELSAAVFAASPPVPPAGDEREHMLQVLRQCHWNISAAAARIGVSRSTLYRRMQRQGIVAPNAADVLGAQGPLRH